MDEYILGINEASCASAAIAKNGEIIAAASEERFTRIKNNWGFPINAINYCLSETKINSSQLSKVVLSYLDPYAHFTEGRAHEQKNTAPSYLKKIRNISPSIEYRLPIAKAIFSPGRSIYYRTIYKSNQSKQIQDISKKINISENRIIRADHHACHAYAAYFSNPNKKDKMLIFTNDGAGDKLCATVNIVNNNKFKRISATHYDHSLGLFYATITGYLGMKAHEDEYKVMGLAPYANEEAGKKILPLFQKLIWVSGLEFKSTIPSRLFGPYLNEKLKGHRFDAIAWASQRHFENLMVQWVKNGTNKTNINNIALSGGSFLNVKANKLIGELPEVKSVYFMPSPGDETNAIGATYYGSKLKKPIANIYLGPSYSQIKVEKITKKYKNLKYVKLKNVPVKVARLLAKGEIVAHFYGRMEFGARALGNRSILANPIKEETVETINKMIKIRDFWMPFAPAIIAADNKKYLINPKNLQSPFMILGYDTTDKGKKDLKNALHRYDKSARPQFVTKEANPRFFDILIEFRKITKISGILNTSFNIHGEPIVATPEDAISTLVRSGLKYLIMEDYLISKK